MISVAIAGAKGRMGTEALHALEMDKRFQIVGLLVRDKHSFSHDNIPVFDDVEELITTVKPNVWLDLTDANSVVLNINRVLEYGVHAVIGATGYRQEDLERWTQLCERTGVGAVAAPNFAIGALLMIRFAQEAARFLQNVEIIELHHDGKRDAPSGTAKRTAEAMSAARGNQAEPTHMSLDDSPARGFMVNQIPIHSIRLPGLVAHQEVLFGGTGETLTIRHDSMSRSSFMPGVLVACEQVMNLGTLVYGLEHLLF